jgi:hypothetical protein
VQGLYKFNSFLNIKFATVKINANFGIGELVITLGSGKRLLNQVPHIYPDCLRIPR